MRQSSSWLGKADEYLVEKLDYIPILKNCASLYKSEPWGVAKSLKQPKTESLANSEMVNS